jgi:hypothetical protein
MMSLRVEKPVKWNNQDFAGYEIVGIEWAFRGDIFYVLTEYFWKSSSKNIRRLVKHQFEVGNDVNVDEMINEVHKMHE